MKNDENKKVNEVIEAKITEDTTTQTEKEPEKKESVFKKLGNGVKAIKNGVKKTLNHEVKLWQVIAAPVIVVGAVIGAKALYEKGHNDALNELDVDVPEIPEEPMMALEVEDEPEEETVVDVEVEDEPEEVYEEEEVME